MITKSDLQEAITKCLTEENPNANTCIKLAAYYTIQNELYPDGGGYSYATFSPSGDSEFSEVAKRAAPETLWSIMDELMETLRVLHPKLYTGVITKLEQ